MNEYTGGQPLTHQRVCRPEIELAVQLVIVHRSADCIDSSLVNTREQADQLKQRCYEVRVGSVTENDKSHRFQYEKLLDAGLKLGFNLRGNNSPMMLVGFAQRTRPAKN